MKNILNYLRNPRRVCPVCGKRTNLFLFENLSAELLCGRCGNYLTIQVSRLRRGRRCLTAQLPYWMEGHP